MSQAALSGWCRREQACSAPLHAVALSFPWLSRMPASTLRSSVTSAKSPPTGCHRSPSPSRHRRPPPARRCEGGWACAWGGDGGWLGGGCAGCDARCDGADMVVAATGRTPCPLPPPPPLPPLLLHRRCCHRLGCWKATTLGPGPGPLVPPAAPLIRPPPVPPPRQPTSPSRGSQYSRLKAHTILLPSRPPQIRSVGGLEARRGLGVARLTADGKIGGQ